MQHVTAEGGRGDAYYLVRRAVDMDVLAYDVRFRGEVAAPESITENDHTWSAALLFEFAKPSAELGLNSKVSKYSAETAIALNRSGRPVPVKVQARQARAVIEIESSDLICLRQRINSRESNPGASLSILEEAYAAV